MIRFIIHWQIYCIILHRLLLFIRAWNVNCEQRAREKERAFNMFVIFTQCGLNFYRYVILLNKIFYKTIRTNEKFATIIICALHTHSSVYTNISIPNRQNLNAFYYKKKYKEKRFADKRTMAHSHFNIEYLKLFVIVKKKSVSV